MSFIPLYCRLCFTLIIFYYHLSFDQQHEVDFRQDGTDGNDVEFYVALCHDVLFEVLQCGNRRQLVKLQRIGRRFYRMIETYFGVKPFLRLNFRLEPGFCFIFFHNSHFNSIMVRSCPVICPQIFKEMKN